MLTCTDTDTRTMLRVISIKRIIEWSCFAWKECYTGHNSTDTIRWNMFGHNNLSKLNAKWIYPTQISHKVFQNTTLYKSFFFFLTHRPVKYWSFLTRWMAKGKKDFFSFSFIFFVCVWWRLTYHHDDQAYKIVDRHNRPQRSHKVITHSVLIVFIL